VLVAKLAIAYATNKILHSTPPAAQNDSEYNSSSGDPSYSLFPPRVGKSKNKELKNVAPALIIEPEIKPFSFKPTSQVMGVPRFS
jgi:hypothetical protein